MNIKNKKFVFPALLLFLTLLVILVPSTTNAMEPVFKVLKDTSTGEGAIVKKVWDRLMNIANALIIIVLIAVAFAQILRINISTYGVKKVLPSLILAIIAANFSFLFCRLLVDFANIIMSLFFDGAAGTGNINSLNQAMKASDIKGSFTDFDSGGIFWFIIAQLLKIAGAIVVYILAYLFFIRNWVIYFLIGLSPLALMSMVLPQTKSLFTQWWSNLLKWIFMPVVSIFWIWLGSQWFSVADALKADIFLVNYVFASVCFYLAITTPFKMGGAIMGQWGNLGKKLWGATGGKAVANGKWLAGGGFASIMTHRNQMAEAKATLEGRKLDAELYRKKASNWTKVNPRAQAEAIKGRFAASRSAFDSAAKKTAYYNRLAGSLATAQAGYDANEDYKYKSAAEIGQMLNDKVRKPDGIWEKISTEYKDELTRLGKDKWDSLDATKQRAMITEYGSEDDAIERLAQHTMAQQFAGTSLPKLITALRGSGIREFDIGETKRIAQQYTSLGRGVKGEEAQNAFFASGAVAENIGEVEQDLLTTAARAIHSALPQQAGSMVAAAMHGSHGIDEIMRQNAASFSGLTPEAQTSIRSSMEQLRKHREDMIENFTKQSEKEYEDEITGIKMVVGQGGRYNSAEIKEGLDKAREALAKGAIDSIKGLPSIISNVGVDSKNPGYREAVQRRIDHLQKGINHFDSLSGFARTDAEAKLMQNPAQYLSEISGKLKAQHVNSAKAMAAGTLLAGSMATNPNLQGASLSSLATNPHAINELTNAAREMSSAASEMKEGMGSINLRGGSIDDVANKAEMRNMMAGAVNGMISKMPAAASNTLGDVNTRRLFAGQLAAALAPQISKGVTGALNKTTLKVDMPTSQAQQPVQGAQNTTTTPAPPSSPAQPTPPQAPSQPTPPPQNQPPKI